MEDFRERKRRRIEALPAANAAAAPKPAPTSAPGFHEIATFLPGRLEFEHELDNDAEELIKDLEFGLVYHYDGDTIPEDDDDLDIKAKRQYDSRGLLHTNGFLRSHSGSASVEPEFKEEPEENGATSPNPNSVAEKEKEQDKESPHVPLPIETEESIAFKLTLLEMYSQRIEKRHEAKAFIFERGLLDYKKVNRHHPGLVGACG